MTKIKWESYGIKGIDEKKKMGQLTTYYMTFLKYDHARSYVETICNIIHSRWISKATCIPCTTTWQSPLIAMHNCWDDKWIKKIKKLEAKSPFHQLI